MIESVTAPSTRKALYRLSTAACFLALGAVASGCAKDKTAEAPTAAPEEAPQAEKFPGKDPTRSEISIAPDILKACGITETDAFFSYNSAKVSPAADGILTKLAECFTTGPLAGKGMNLVGHADPRGDDEYNMTLGGQRSDNVAAALEKKGLPSAQMNTTSRGEMDATGDDEASWAKDRKVEVFLAE